MASKALKYIGAGILLLVSSRYLYLLTTTTTEDIGNRSNNRSKHQHIGSNNNDRASAYCGRHLKGDACNIMASRVISYCAENIPSGTEGVFPGSKDWELKRVVLTIRHGDRSTLNFIPGSNSLSLLSKAMAQSNSTSSSVNSSPYYDAEAIDYLHRVTSFKVVELQGINQSANNINTDHFNIHSYSLSESTSFHKPDRLIDPGQLTTKGFMQHINLGKHFLNAYNPLISQIKQIDDIYIRSTNYDRTIQSAMALASTMLPALGGPSNTKTTTDIHQIPIHVYREESSEMMHGIGLRLSSKSADGRGDEITPGSCKRASVLADKQRKAFSTSKLVVNDISRIFNQEALTRPVTDIVDAALPQVCHSEPLPCSSSSSRGCMDMHFLGTAMAEGDRYFCDRYMGKDGGAEATKLSIQPLMTEILSRLKESDSNASKLLSVLSGHDTVIAPVLAALGVFNNDMCTWPPYASRISFELWQKKQNSNSNSDEALHVRVLYNGEDITRLIPACKTAYSTVHAYSALRPASTSSQLCPLSALTKQIESLLGPFQSLSEACNA